MASYTSTGCSAHHTLTASTVDVVTLDKGYGSIEVVNRDASADLWFTIDRGANNTILTPTVAGDGCYYVGPGAVRTVADDVIFGGSPTSIIRLISVAAVAYSTTGY